MIGTDCPIDGYWKRYFIICQGESGKCATSDGAQVCSEHKPTAAPTLDPSIKSTVTLTV